MKYRDRPPYNIMKWSTLAAEMQMMQMQIPSNDFWRV